MFGTRAATLLREVAFTTPQTLPAYNDEAVRLCLDEVSEHHSEMNRIIREVETANAQAKQTTEAGPSGLDEQRPEAATNWQQKVRQDAVIDLRWRGRILPADIKQQLHPSEQQLFKNYDNLLIKYMSSPFINMDLTLDDTPPKASSAEYEAMQDFGEVVLSLGRYNLVLGQRVLLPVDEAQGLVRSGVLKCREHREQDAWC